MNEQITPAFELIINSMKGIQLIRLEVISKICLFFVPYWNLEILFVIKKGKRNFIKDFH